MLAKVSWVTPEVGEVKRENTMRRAANMKVRDDSITIFPIWVVRKFAMDPYVQIGNFLAKSD